MFISKKKYNELVKRIEAVERKTEVNTWDFGRVDLKELCKRLPDYIDKKIGIRPAKKLYLCDPTKNVGCKRSVGGECSSEYCAATTNPEYAKLDEYGEPIRVSALTSN